MKKGLILIIIIFLPFLICTGQNKPKQEIQPYIKFLNSTETLNSKDYILSLWDKYDIVVICERFHGEVTQYNLLLDIINDERFITSVGNVFTEVGSVSIQPDINHFLQSKYLNEKQRKDDLLNIYRNLTFSPSWEKYNFFNFILEINKLNCKIEDSLSIHLYPLTWEFPGWKNIETSAKYKEWFYNQPDFDSILASHFIEQYDKILTNEARKKALIVLNYRHAFNKDMKNEMYEKTINVSNTARYIFDNYKGKVANILLNTLTSLPADNSDMGDPYIPIQNGKWDAAFKFSNIKNSGFDFYNSPFGEDSFDLWPYSKIENKYKDVFTGFVFYLPLNEHYELYGIPNIMTKEFEVELRRRLKIFYGVWNYKLQGGQKPAINKSIRHLGKLKKERYYNLNKKLKIIDKWLSE